MNIFENAWQTLTGEKAGAKAEEAGTTIATAAEAAAAQYKPYQEAGATALGRISDIMSGKTRVSLADIPGYKAGLGAGRAAIERAGVAGHGVGGGTLAALFGFGQQYAGQAFQQYMGQLGSLAGLGMEATGAATGLRMQGAAGTAAGIQGSAAAGQAGMQRLVGLASMAAGGIGGIGGMMGGASLGGTVGGYISNLGTATPSALTATPGQLTSSYYSMG